MSRCSFCMNDGGMKGCQKVNNTKVIGFLCQEFNLDLGKTFGVNPGTSSKPISFIIYLCSVCFELFQRICDMVLELEVLKGKLGKVLSEVRNTILTAASPNKSLAQAEGSGVGSSSDKTQGILVRGAHSFGRKEVLETEKNTDKTSVVEAVDHVQIKTGIIGSTYEEEDVEEFNDLIPTGEIASSPASHVELDSFMEEDNEKSNIPSHIANAGPKKTRNTSSSQDQVPLLHDHNYFQNSEITCEPQCELCDYRGRRFKDMHSLRSHIQISHESAPLLYNCPQGNCEKRFPVEILLKKHILFHEEESIKMFGCLDCDERFDTGKSWNSHVSWHEKQILNAPVILSNLEKLENRVSAALKKQEKQASLELSRKASLIHKQPRAGFRYSRCRFCNYGSKSPKNIRYHEEAQHQDKLLHRCNSCDQKYSSTSILETHVQTHTSNGPYQCMLCVTGWETGHELDEHLVIDHIPQYPKPRHVTTSTETKCNICGRLYTTNKKLTLHLQSAHGDRKSYGCEVCTEKYFYNFPSYLNHIMKHHEIGQKVLNCSKCPKQFATNLMLQRHSKTHTLYADGTAKLSCDICEAIFKQDDLTALEKHKISVHGTQGRQNRYKCQARDCDQFFSSTLILRVHENTRHPELFIYSCKLCDKVYSIEGFLETHMRTHEEATGSVEQYVCTVCGQRFSTGTGLADHFSSHTGELKHHCAKCPRKFYSKRDMNIHLIRAHQATKPFVCNVCGKGFAINYNLKKHRDVHEDVMDLLKRDPKTCRHCGMKFPTQWSLKTHVSNKHTFKLPVSKMCDICGKVLKTLKSLNSHMRTHEVDKKKQVCYFCNKKFAINSILSRHIIRTHTRERPFVCHICPLNFNDTSYLAKHVEVHKNSGTYFPKPKLVY